MVICLHVAERVGMKPTTHGLEPGSRYGSCRFPRSRDSSCAELARVPRYGRACETLFLLLASVVLCPGACAILDGRLQSGPKEVIGQHAGVVQTRWVIAWHVPCVEWERFASDSLTSVKLQGGSAAPAMTPADAARAARAARLEVRRRSRSRLRTEEVGYYEGMYSALNSV